MPSIETYLFNNDLAKNAEAKRRIVSRLIETRGCSIADAAKALDISVPTVTKLIGELVEEGVAADLGKVETAGGRRPNAFGILHPEEYHLLGAEIKSRHIELIITDLHSNILKSHSLAATPNESLEIIKNFAQKNDTYNIIGVGVAVPCRVNPAQGRTFGMFDEGDVPLRDALHQQLRLPVQIDTVARAKCAAERAPESDILYINVDHALTAAAVIDGKPYYGHGGFAADVARGELLPPETDLEKLVEQAKRDVQTAVEVIATAAETAGPLVAALAGAFNPELIVIGGTLALSDDYFMLPLQAAVHRHTAKTLYRDTRFRLAHATQHAAAVGATMILMK